MINAMRLLFWIVKNQLNSITNKAPIYLRIAVDTRRAELSTGVWATIDQWDSIKQQLRGRSDEIKIANLKLSELRNKAETYFLDFEKKGRKVTASELKELITGKSLINVTFLELFALFIEEKKKIVGKSLSPASIESYTVRRNNLHSFLTAIKRTQILPGDFRPKYGRDFADYLIHNKGLNQNYVSKIMQTIGQVLRFGVQREILLTNPLEGFTVPKGEMKELIYLEIEEVQTLAQWEFINPGIARARDLFVFSCFTGLAYRDAQNITRDNIYIGVDGREWLKSKRQKTRKSNSIATLPLVAQAKALLEKYSYQLPRMTNQTYNEHLKHIGEIVGFGKHISTHCGRKSFVNLCLNEFKFPPETVSAMIGHKDHRLLLKVYGRISEKRIADDVKEMK